MMVVPDGVILGNGIVEEVDVRLLRVEVNETVPDCN